MTKLNKLIISFGALDILLVVPQNKNPRKSEKILAGHTLLRPTFSFTYHKFALPLTKFLVKHLHGDQEAVEEVFADTIEAAWRGHNAFQNKSTYYTWLCRIGLNKIADYYRRRVNSRSGIIAPILDNLARVEDINPTPEEKVALDELKLALLDCLDLVPNKYHHILHLHFWKELTIREIAITMGISERSVEGKLYRAKKAYQKVFKTKYPSLAPSSIYSKK